MALKEIKVESKTLNQISEIVNHDPQGHQLIKKTIIDSIEKLWINVCNSQSSLVLIDEIFYEINPKPKYQNTIKEITGFDGPYIATKICKSHIGLSEGVYQLNDSTIIPVSWFKPKKSTSKFNLLLMILCIVLNIIQSILLVLLII